MKKIFLLVIFIFGILFMLKPIPISAQGATATPPVSSAKCTAFTDDFSETTPDKTLWDIWAGKGSVTYSTLGVKIAMPLQAATPTPATNSKGMTSKKDLVGNFSTEITSKITTVTAGKKVGYVQYGIFIPLSDGTHFQQVLIARYVGENKLEWGWNQSTTSWKGVRGSVTVSGMTNDTDIKFKITRIGKAINIYYSVKTNTVFGPYKLIKSIPLFTDKTGRLFMQVIPKAPDFPATSGTFDDLKVSCPKAGPTVTPNPNCKCVSNTCTSACTFHKVTGVNYPASIKCNLVATLFSKAPTVADKTDWCQRLERTKGDADGKGNIVTPNIKVTNTDYFYYVSVVNGGKVPPSINPDFNGDGEVGASDRIIIIKSL